MNNSELAKAAKQIAKYAYECNTSVHQWVDQTPGVTKHNRARLIALAQEYKADLEHYWDSCYY